MLRRSTLTPYLLKEFVQTDPHWHCNRQDGPCADHRCSFQCRNRWAATERAAIVQTLADLDEGSIFAGNLVLHAWASVEDHRAARKRFNRYLRDTCKGKAFRIKVRCYTHVAQRDADRRPWRRGAKAKFLFASVHYDFVAFSTLPADCNEVRKIVGDCWNTAWRGLKTEVKVDPVAPRTRTHRHGAITVQTNLTLEDVIDWIARYTVKDLKDVREGRLHVYLLMRNGLDLVWGSSGFFRGRNRRILAKQFWDRVSEDIPPDKTATHQLLALEFAGTDD